MKFVDLPYGVTCTRPDSRYSFVRVRSKNYIWEVVTLGQDDGILSHISELVDKWDEQDDFYVIDYFQVKPVKAVKKKRTRKKKAT